MEANIDKNHAHSHSFTLRLSLLTLIRKVHNTSTLMSSLLLFPICQVFVMRFCKCCSCYKCFLPILCACTDWVSNVIQTNKLYACVCVCVTKSIASTTDCVICKTKPTQYRNTKLMQEFIGVEWSRTNGMAWNWIETVWGVKGSNEATE